MHLPEYGYQFSCERKSGLISCTKGGTMYVECLALHQVQAVKLCYIYLYTYLEPLLNCQCYSSYGVVVTRTLERILFLDLGLAVTEVNTKKV